MTEQDIKKSVDEIVGKILETEKPAEQTPAEEVNKAITSESVAPVASVTPAAETVAPETSASNGGATQALADPSAVAAQVAKSEDEEEDEDEEEKEDEDEEEEEKPKKKMKKSIEELSEILDEEELELVKCWREESEKPAEQVAKSIEATPAPAAEEKPAQPSFEEVLKKAVFEGTADLRKALDEKDTLIKSLSEKVEKLASQPAYDKRSVSNLEIIEKSNGAPASNEIKKSQVLNTMLALQADGKGITSHHVAEFEATGNISDARVKRIVFQELKLD